MKSNVVYYILLLLDSENSVRIPGLGRLSRRVKPARVSKEEWTAAPPESTVDFTASEKKKGKLLARYIAYKSGVDSQAASNHVNEFATTIASELQESGRVSVDYLGVFQKKQDQIYFTANTETANAAYHGLKTVQLPTSSLRSESEIDGSEVAPDFEEKTVTVTPNPTVSEEENVDAEIVAVSQSVGGMPHPIVPSKNEGLPSGASVRIKDDDKKRLRVPVLLPIFLVIFLGVTALAVMQYNKRGAIYHPAATYNRAPGQQTPLFGSGAESKNDAGVTADNNEEPLENEKASHDEILDNTFDVLGFSTELDNSGKDNNEEQFSAPAEKEELIVNEMKSADRSTVDTESNGTGISGLGDITASSSDSTIDETEPDPVENHLPVKDSGEDALTSDCYVIVGAFGVQSNVDRMLVRLTEMGYQPAKMARNKLTQIGVPAPCGSSEVQRVLADLQLNVEAEAWIYNR